MTDSIKVQVTFRDGFVVSYTLPTGTAMERVLWMGRPDRDEQVCVELERIDCGTFYFSEPASTLTDSGLFFVDVEMFGDRGQRTGMRRGYFTTEQLAREFYDLFSPDRPRHRAYEPFAHRPVALKVWNRMPDSLIELERR